VLIIPNHTKVNDDLIIDCCQYFKTKGGTVVLWTEDNLLKFRSRHHGELQYLCRCDESHTVLFLAADIILKRPDHVRDSGWNSQAVARFLNFPEDLVERFSHNARYGRTEGGRANPSGSLFVDRMEVDYVLSIHPKDALHLDMIERLGEYICELIDGVMPRGVRESVGRSPEMVKKQAMWKRVKIEDWTLYDCIQYMAEGGLSGGGLGWLNQREADYLTHFLTATSQENGYGTPKGKPGNTWTTAQWQKAMGSLDKGGKRAEEKGFSAVQVYVDRLREEAREINLVL